MRKTRMRRLVGLCIGLAAVCLLGCSASFPKLEAAGHRVSEEEYLRAMYQARNDVLSDHAAAGISLTDWTAETALGDPCALVTERAVALLREYYAVSTLAVERGYLQDAGYDAMLRDLEEVNRQRREALEAGTVITGIPAFTPEDYITYRASHLRVQFCDDPGNPENQVTSGELRARYDADKDSLYLLPDELELAYLVIDADPEEADARYAELEELRQRASERGSLAAALTDNMMPHYGEIVVDQSTYSVYARSHGDILACAEGLRSGELSRVFRQEGWLCLVECRNRVEHTYVPLEDIQSVVLQSIRESRYDALIAERAANLEIAGDLEALYRFTAEQFS